MRNEVQKFRANGTFVWRTPSSIGVGALAARPCPFSVTAFPGDGRAGARGQGQGQGCKRQEGGTCCRGSLRGLCSLNTQLESAGQPKLCLTQGLDPHPLQRPCMQFYVPTDCTHSAASGSIWVVDYGNKRMVELNATTGEQLSTLSPITFPNIVVDAPDGTLFVSGEQGGPGVAPRAPLPPHAGPGGGRQLPCDAPPPLPPCCGLPLRRASVLAAPHACRQPLHERDTGDTGWGDPHQVWPVRPDVQPNDQPVQQHRGGGRPLGGGRTHHGLCLRQQL